jgi:hypothetical protein
MGSGYFFIVNLGAPSIRLLLARAGAAQSLNPTTRLPGATEHICPTVKPGPCGKSTARPPPAVPQNDARSRGTIEHQSSTNRGTIQGIAGIPGHLPPCATRTARRPAVRARLSAASPCRVPRLYSLRQASSRSVSSSTSPSATTSTATLSVCSSPPTSTPRMGLTSP